MAFTTAQKVDIRRHCGYPVYGGTPSSFQSYRFFQSYGTLEYRLSNLMPEEEAVITGTFLPNLASLEAAIPGVSANLDTDQAAVWTHNKNELRDREVLFSSYRRKLCGFLGVPPGPELSAGGGIRIVV